MKKKNQKVITWEETIYKKKVHKISVEFPVFFIDTYGYTCYSKDGSTTIEIGLNGTQCNPKDSHSIKVRDYFSGEGYLKRKKDITLNEWREALQKVEKQIKQFIEATL